MNLGGRGLSQMEATNGELAMVEGLCCMFCMTPWSWSFMAQSSASQRGILSPPEGSGGWTLLASPLGVGARTDGCGGRGGGFIFGGGGCKPSKLGGLDCRIVWLGLVLGWGGISGGGGGGIGRFLWSRAFIRAWFCSAMRLMLLVSSMKYCGGLFGLGGSAWWSAAFW